MKRAFSLLEVLIVVAVITVVAIFLLTILGAAGRPRSSGKRTSCSSNLRQIGTGIIQYAQDYDDYFPPARVTASIGWADVLQPYVKSTLLFQCPPTDQVPVKFSTDYFYNRRLARLPLQALKDSALTIVTGDGDDDAPTWNSWTGLPSDAATNSSPSQRHNGAANYCFVDGHVKLYPPNGISSTYAAPTSSPTFAVR